jgi:predicted TIM-barrel fold metal-dependent hydrolase
MASRSLPFPVFDADNHLYETEEALTRYLPPAQRGAIDYVDVRGRKKIVIRGQVSDYIPNPTFDRVGRPGALVEYFRHGNPEGKTQRELMGRGIDCPESFRNAPARLKLMDEQGLDYAIMLPTLASLVEERMRDDAELCADAIHALNQWMVDEWPFAHEGRIFSVPIITPGLVDRAIAELDYVLENGARFILMRPAPAWGYHGARSFATPEFDPYWRRVQESGVIVIIHASDSGYTRYVNEWEGSRQEMTAFGAVRLFSAVVGGRHRDIEDAVTSIIAHGLLWRFPDLKIALIENGAGWVPNLLKHLDHTANKMPKAFPELPSDTFRRSIYMHPFHEERPHDLIELLGADRIIFGSDFPHVEGLADPIAYVDELAGLPQDQIEMIMGGNMLRLLERKGAAVS